ncbi:MAG: hypothetical protein V1787_03000 [Candidatus Micrarchaeota archaeon]
MGKLAQGQASLKFKAVVLTFIALAALSAAEFGQTTVYFNVPISTSFTVTLPESTEANASGATAPPGAPATADLNFSSLTGTETHLQPCLTAAWGSACQTGPAVPIFSYKNTGTVNISMYIMFNTTLPIGVTVGINSTKSGTGNNAVVHSDLYDVNNSEWAAVFEDLNISAGMVVNVTLYANFSNVNGFSARLLSHNSTQS